MNSQEPARTIVYHGYWDSTGNAIVRVSSQDSPPIRLLHYLAMDPYRWGDKSNASRTLAYAILLHAAGLDTASQFCGPFLDEIISTLPPGAWRLTSAQVCFWLSSHRNSVSRPEPETPSLSACES